MTEVPVNSGERALDRMRRYTTISLVGVFGAFLLMTVVGTTDPLNQVLYAVAGILVMAQSFYWEKGPPLWLGVLAVTGTYVIWIWAVLSRDVPFASVLAGVAIALHTAFPRPRRTWWILAGGASLLGPLIGAALAQPDLNWYPWFVAACAGYLGAVAFFLLNTYAFGLYLEIDAARRVSAELAVAQERYRFAADLHDIQGHTLHVIRLKTRLASKLLEKDASAARAQLVEADELIAETLANTRSLAFGDRHVGLASELANARELFLAAGIDCTVSGSPPPGAPLPRQHDELLGLVMRETTTNILRHAQATTVTVTLDAATLTIVNDGSPASTRPLSGLARLGERFEAIGGRLTTSQSGGQFTTRAVAS